MDVTATTGGVLTAEDATASRDCELVQVGEKRERKSAEENLKSRVQISRERDVNVGVTSSCSVCSSDVLLNIF